MAEPRQPADFAEILTLPEHPLIVGGQAVNIWAEHFASKDAKLDGFRPFISKDADIVGDRAMAERLAEITNWKLTPYYEPRAVGLAMLTKELPNHVKLIVEVIGSVNGLTQKDLVDSDLVELIPGQVYRIPSPIILLKAKLANVAQIDQTRRQDARHVQMLIPCAREYLRESHCESLAGRMTERRVVNLFEAAHSLYRDPGNVELGRKHEFDLLEVFPKELSCSPIAKVARFFEYRMKELSTSNESDSPALRELRPKVPDWTLESMTNPSETSKNREKSKGPELEIDY
jgi:hypothetical protein